jgi:predicted GIY-YIG superfamily endonuclease
MKNRSLSAAEAHGFLGREGDMKRWMYILECSDGTFYTGSTNNLALRLEQHLNGEGSDYTKTRLPVDLVYTEEFCRIDFAFFREKQVQGWNRKKKLALIQNKQNELHALAACKNSSNSIYREFREGGLGCVQQTPER